MWDEEGQDQCGMRKDRSTLWKYTAATTLLILHSLSSLSQGDSAFLESFQTYCVWKLDGLITSPFLSVENSILMWMKSRSTVDKDKKWRK